MQSTIRYILAMAFAWLIAKGVITQDQADSILPGFVNGFAIIASGFVLVFWSWLEKYAKGWIDASLPSFILGRTPPSVNMLLVLAAVGGCALIPVSCAPSPTPAPSPAPSGNVTPTPTPAPTVLPMPSSTVTGGISLITSAGLTAYLDFGITQQSTRVRLSSYIDTGATLTLQLAGNQAVTPAQYSTYLTTYGIQGDSDYAAVASELTTLYSTFIYPKLQGGSGPAIEAYLTAFATGLQSGAAVYAPSTVLPPAN